MKSDTKDKGSGGSWPKRGVRLNRPQDVRRLLSRLINQAMKKEIDTDLLRAVTYASATLLKSFEIGELSERLSEIEKKILL